MKPTPFELEGQFQHQLETHPELLAGDLIDPERPRKWVLVRREMSVPNGLDNPGWWSADRVFLDQDGIPTIVEVKRQSDTRLRREVIAQLLEYAANGVEYWPSDTLRSTFEETCQGNDKDPDQELQARFGEELDTSIYWERVKTNLEAHRIRLLFVADVVPRELRRMVEFLNGQMTTVEVLALELRQFVGEKGQRTIVPSLFRQTEEARGQKANTARRYWDREAAAKSRHLMHVDVVAAPGMLEQRLQGRSVGIFPAAAVLEPLVQL